MTYKISDLFANYIQEGREPGKAYCASMIGPDGKHKGYVSCTKWGHKKYWQPHAKDSALRHAGVENVENGDAGGGMDEEVACAEKITSDPNLPTSRMIGTDSVVKVFKDATPGQSVKKPSLNESYELAFDYQGKPQLAPTAGDLMMRAKGAFAHHVDVQSVIDVRGIKESIQKQFERTVLEEDSEQLKQKCEILTDMVEHALSTIDKIKSMNIDRDAWAEAQILKMETYMESVLKYIDNINEASDEAADVIGVQIPAYKVVDPRTGEVRFVKGRTVKRRQMRKIGKDDEEPKGPLSV